MKLIGQVPSEKKWLLGQNTIRTKTRSGAKMNSILHQAVSSGDKDLVIKILHPSSRCDLMKTDFDGWTALHWACFRNQPEIIELLFERLGSDSRREYVMIEDIVR